MSPYSLLPSVPSVHTAERHRVNGIMSSKEQPAINNISNTMRTMLDAHENRDLHVLLNGRNTGPIK